MNTPIDNTEASRLVDSILETERAKHVYEAMQRRDQLRKRLLPREKRFVLWLVMFFGLLLMNFVKDLAIEQGIGKLLATIIGALSYSVVMLVAYVDRLTRRLNAAIELLTLDEQHKG